MENNLCEEIQQLDNKIITKEDFKKLYIENKINKICDALRKELINLGYTFKSETDTEVLVHLIDDIKKKEEKLREMPCPSEKKTCHVIPEGKFQYNYKILSFPMKLFACSIQFFTDSMKCLHSLHVTFPNYLEFP